MSQIVHLRTVIQVQFGVLDENGNAHPQEPIVAEGSIFSAEAFVEAFEKIRDKRDELSESSSEASKAQKSQN